MDSEDSSDSRMIGIQDASVPEGEYEYDSHNGELFMLRGCISDEEEAPAVETVG